MLFQMEYQNEKRGRIRLQNMFMKDFANALRILAMLAAFLALGMVACRQEELH